MRARPVYDFHTHTFLSDGVLIPIELIRNAVANGYAAIGITDHASAGHMESVLRTVIADCALAEKHWDIRAIPGVELTHLPPAAVAELAAEARRRRAKQVVVHGETPVEPVLTGTNLAAVECPQVDILAHPGPIGPDIAELAARSGVFLEISTHHGHCLGNGAVAAAARAAGAPLLVNSDAHKPEEVLTGDFAHRVAAGAGLDAAEIEAALTRNPQRLLERIAGRG
jgi:putative hydrolase